MFSTPQILYEDNHVIVALKEPNLLSQADSTGDQDILSLLKDYIKVKYEKPGDVYLGLIHRIDRPVGGLLVFARTSKAASRLSEQLRKKEINREYVAVVCGNPPEHFTLRNFLVKDPEKNMVQCVPAWTRQGKEAILHAKTVVRTPGEALVCVRLETGRAHQIRTQMANAGFPLRGDHRYGAKNKEQIFLWGMYLSFKHPISGKNMVFVSPPPLDKAEVRAEALEETPDMINLLEDQDDAVATDALDEEAVVAGWKKLQREKEQAPAKQETTEGSEAISEKPAAAPVKGWMKYQREIEGLTAIWPDIRENIPLE